MRPLVIIPVYNEIENIKNIIQKVEICLENFEHGILVVDDNSTDGTSETLIELKERYLNLSILKRNGKLGLASAYIDGIKYGINRGFDVFVEMDADFSHNPDYLKSMLEQIKDYDLVIGSRYVKGGNVSGLGILRKIISKGGSLYSKIILNCPINDLTGGFNIWKKEIIDKIGLENIISKGYSFQIEMKYRAYLKGAKFLEYPITFVDRKYGKSKMNKDIFIEAFLNIIRLRFICKR